MINSEYLGMTFWLDDDNELRPTSYIKRERVWNQSSNTISVKKGKGGGYIPVTDHYELWNIRGQILPGPLYREDPKNTNSKSRDSSIRYGGPNTQEPKGNNNMYDPFNFVLETCKKNK